MILATVTTIPTWFLSASLGLIGFGFAGLIAVIGFFLRRLVDQLDDQDRRLSKVERIVLGGRAA